MANAEPCARCSNFKASFLLYSLHLMLLFVSYPQMCFAVPNPYTSVFCDLVDKQATSNGACGSKEIRAEVTMLQVCLLHQDID